MHDIQNPRQQVDPRYLPNFGEMVNEVQIGSGVIPILFRYTTFEEKGGRVD
jgi:hypothetical protein